MALSDRHAAMVVEAVCAGLGHRRVRVFVVGSFARGEERLASDLDVLVDCGARLTPSERGRVRESLEESWLPYTVDLVDAHALAPERRASMWRGARLLAPGPVGP